MKKCIALLGVILFGIMIIWNVTFNSDNESYELIFANAEALAGPGGGGEPGSSGGDGCGGYRKWNVSGIFAAKKHFYDCECILREGYKPSADCLGGN